jgi:pimeloyl-ACP methyl ester carboxylesterase
MNILPFTVDVPESKLQDLKARLDITRWPDEIAGSEWDYGTNMAYLKELVEYWRTSFDWRAQEALLNNFSHFKAQVDGLGIHFIHEKGKGPNPIPLIVTHGWPGTFFEMHKIIPMLADPASYGGDPVDAFDVVAPSMPGYGFSDHPADSGMDVLSVGNVMATLMTEGLGYHQYGAQGGDWGASVTAKLGLSYPEKVIGIHTTSVVRPTPYLGPGSRQLTEAEEELLAQRSDWLASEGGYSHIQGTKPQTLSYGLNDSPAGLAAWILEKYRTWSDCGGDIESRFTKDELLTTITIYWVTESIGSSTRLYYETLRRPWELGQNERINVPCAVAIFPKELSQPPREWAERSYNVQQWTVMPSGGHFAALEEPARLVDDVRNFFRPLR